MLNDWNSRESAVWYHVGNGQPVAEEEHWPTTQTSISVKRSNMRNHTDGECSRRTREPMSGDEFTVPFRLARVVPRQSIRRPGIRKTTRKIFGVPSTVASIHRTTVRKSK